MNKKIILSIFAAATLGMSNLSFSRDLLMDTLINAIKSNDKKTISNLLKKKTFDINKPFEVGQYKDFTAISVACMRDNAKIVKLLLKNGANFDEECIKTSESKNSKDSKNALKYLYLAKYLDILASDKNNHFKLLSFIDNQSDDKNVKFLNKRLLKKYGIKYENLKESINKIENKNLKIVTKK